MPSAALDQALRELAAVEQALLVTRDAATLQRFGNPEEGAEIAERFGYAGLTIEEARVVDRLIWLPDAASLIREYLDTVSAPRLARSGSGQADRNRSSGSTASSS